LYVFFIAIMCATWPAHLTLLAMWLVHSLWLDLRLFRQSTFQLHSLAYTVWNVIYIWYFVHSNNWAVIQGDRKVTQPIPDTCSICHKINYIEIRKQRTMLCCVGNVHRVQRCIHSFPHVWYNPVKSSCVTETFHQKRYCRFVWHRKIGKCIPKLIMVI
jgi:hypothetical protein